MCPTGVLSLNTVYKPCQSASLTFRPLPWIVISWNSRVAFFVFLKFSLFNAHSVTALETHTFLTPYSVDVCIAVPAVCTLRFIHAWCKDTRAHLNPLSRVHPSLFSNPLLLAPTFPRKRNPGKQTRRMLT